MSECEPDVPMDERQEFEIVAEVCSFATAQWGAFGAHMKAAGFSLVEVEMALRRFGERVGRDL